MLSTEQLMLELGFQKEPWLVGLYSFNSSHSDHRK